MTQRTRLALPRRPADEADTLPDHPRARRQPVRGRGSAPRKRPTAAEAEQAREQAREQAQKEARHQPPERAPGPHTAKPARHGAADKPRAAKPAGRAPDAPPRDKRLGDDRRPPRDQPDDGRAGRRDAPRPTRGRPTGAAGASDPRHRHVDTRPGDPAHAADRRHGGGMRSERQGARAASDDRPRRQERPDHADRSSLPAHRDPVARSTGPAGTPPRDHPRPPARSQRPLGDARGNRPFGTEDRAASRPAERHAAFTPAQRRAPSDSAPSGPGTPPVSAATSADAGIRLSKRMSELGLASRREADEWIAQGWVRVDGRVVSELGSRVLPHQQITVDEAARQQQAQRVTVLLHKPVGYVSGQAEDGYTPAVALVTAENRWAGDRTAIRYSPVQRRHLAPAGRLDIDSTGLLVLTQDGRIAKLLIGEDSPIEKEYLVRVRLAAGQPEGAHASELLPPEALERLRHGLALDGVPLQPAKVSWQNEDQLRFVLREGRKRQIRRMCEAVGLEVVGLKRVRIGRITLSDLPPGQWRYLRPDERF